VVQHLLGVKPVAEGLRIDPCIPRSWKGFALKRRFRGGMVEIEVHNPAALCRGVRRLEVDGKPLDGNVLPAELAAKGCRVVVVLED